MPTRRLVLAAAGACAALAAGTSAGSAAHAAVGQPTGRSASMALGSIVVASGGDTIAVFAPGARGNVAPLRRITGGATNFHDMDTLDVDNVGNIWTANFQGGLIQKFSGAANGNVRPIASLKENGNNDELPLGVAVTNDGRHVWIGNDGSSVLSSYSTSASGSTTAAQRITGSNTGIAYSRDVTLSPNGKRLYQADGGNAEVHEYASGGPENQTPIRTIGLGAQKQVQGVAVDLTGNVWVSDSQTNSLYEFGRSGNAAIRTISGSNTGLDNPAGVTLDAAGNVWVAIEGNQASSKPSAVEAFKPTAHGNAAPFVRIAGAKTQLAFASDVVVYGAQPGAPRHLAVSGGRSGFHLTWKAPANTGGGLIGYVVERKVGKHAKWKVIARTHKRRYTDGFGAARPKPGHIYQYAAIAYNEFGASGQSKPAKGKTK